MCIWARDIKDIKERENTHGKDISIDISDAATATVADSSKTGQKVEFQINKYRKNYIEWVYWKLILHVKLLDKYFFRDVS